MEDLLEANQAGREKSIDCTLIITEGDSARTFALSGLDAIGRDKYGVYTVCGKMLNVRQATFQQILDDKEVVNLVKIIGLKFYEKYQTKKSLKELRYGKIMILTDQDYNGSLFKGLIINFVHHQWPNLIKHGFVDEFRTPIVKVTKNFQKKSFYSSHEFEQWQQNIEDLSSWKIKYYRGLGTSTSTEVKEYFNDITKHRIKFEYTSFRDDLSIHLAFGRKFKDEIKYWLTKFMEDRKHRIENSLPENYLYKEDTKSIKFTDFVFKELVLSYNLHNERSIPSIMDGFKPHERKIIFTCFKLNLVKELKVSHLTNSVAKLSSNHHDLTSLDDTIKSLAQNFVGSNNINLLLPVGQFGTRLRGGKDAASAHYIFTHLNPLTRLIFNSKDDQLLKYLNDDGLIVEPYWYCPIIPTVLVNGAEGFGSEWSTNIPKYNPRDLIYNLKQMINGQNTKPIFPYYKNFLGKIEQADDKSFMIYGVLTLIGNNTIEITELPIGTWTQAYKENVLEPFLKGYYDFEIRKLNQGVITNYKEYNTDTTVRFLVEMTPEQFINARDVGFYKFFKLQKSVSFDSMVLFDPYGCLKRYETVNEILNEFFTIRTKLYAKRKNCMESFLEAEILKLKNIVRFLLEKIENKIKIEDLKKLEVCKILKSFNYDPDPVDRWKKIINKNGYGEYLNMNYNQSNESQIVSEFNNEKK